MNMLCLFKTFSLSVVILYNRFYWIQFKCVLYDLFYNVFEYKNHWFELFIWYDQIRIYIFAIWNIIENESFMDGKCENSAVTVLTPNLFRLLHEGMKNNFQYCPPFFPYYKILRVIEKEMFALNPLLLSTLSSNITNGKEK